MKKRTIMAAPRTCFFSVVTVCVIGIIIGSFCDYRINVVLANKTDLGAFFATYGSYFSYCLYPAAGACLYVGFRKKGERFRLLAWTLLILSFFMAVYYSNSYNGKNVRALFGYTAGESSVLLSVLSWLFWVVLYAWVPFVMVRLLDDKNPDKLIAIGAAILVACIAADNVNLWLKQVASRPRYKYLITLDDPEERVSQLVADDPESCRQRRQFQILAQRQYDHRQYDVLAPHAGGCDEKEKRWKKSPLLHRSLPFCADLWLQPHPHDQSLPVRRMLWDSDHLSDLCYSEQGVFEWGRERIRITASPKDLKYAGTFRIQYEKEFHGRMFRDNEVTTVYVYDRPVDIDALTLQDSEVSEVHWFDLEEVWNEIQTDRHRFCVPAGGLKVLREYLNGEDAI